MFPPVKFRPSYWHLRSVFIMHQFCMWDSSRTKLSVKSRSISCYVRVNWTPFLVVVIVFIVKSIIHKLFLFQIHLSGFLHKKISSYVDFTKLMIICGILYLMNFQLKLHMPFHGPQIQHKEALFTLYSAHSSFIKYDSYLFRMILQ